MKVIFLEDIPNVARAGETKEVADGYGRNFLIPRKLASLAKPVAINTMEAQFKMKARQQSQSEAELAKLAQKLDGVEINLSAKAGAKDRLYGSVTNADIASELTDATGLDIDKRKIELAEPIHKLGNYEVTIRLAQDIIPKIKVTVTAAEKE